MTPHGNNADEWNLFIEECLGIYSPFLAVQIATAIDRAFAAGIASDELAKALRPFAKCADSIIDDSNFDTRPWAKMSKDLTIGDYRAAYRALAAYERGKAQPSESGIPEALKSLLPLRRQLNGMMSDGVPEFFAEIEISYPDDAHWTEREDAGSRAYDIAEAIVIILNEYSSALSAARAEGRREGLEEAAIALEYHASERMFGGPPSEYTCANIIRALKETEP